VIEVQKAADAPRNLTRQLLAFSRKQVLETKILNLSDVCERPRGHLHRLIGEDVHLATRAAPTSGRVARTAASSAGILNLVVNARDAEPRGGECW